MTEFVNATLHLDTIASPTLVKPVLLTLAKILSTILRASSKAPNVFLVVLISLRILKMRLHVYATQDSLFQEKTVFVMEITTIKS